MTQHKSARGGQSRLDRMLARRAAIAKLLAHASLTNTKPTQRELAEKFGVSHTTINKDLKALRELWADEEKLGGVYFQRSIVLTDQIIEAHKTNAIDAVCPKSAGLIIKAIEQQRKTLGYDTPTKEKLAQASRDLVNVTTFGKMVDAISLAIGEVIQDICNNEDDRNRATEMMDGKLELLYHEFLSGIMDRGKHAEA